MTLNQSLSSVDAGRIHGRREEILLEHAGYGDGLMERLRTGFQQVEIQSGVNAIMATGGIRVNDSSIDITNPAGPGNNFLLGGDSNNFFDLSSNNGGGGATGEAGAPGLPGTPGADGADGIDGAPGAGGFWEDNLGTVLEGDGLAVDTAFSVKFDPDIDATKEHEVLFDESTYPSGVASGSLNLLAGHTGSDSYEIVDGELILKFHMVRLYLDRNDGDGTVEAHIDYISAHDIAIPLEVQLCPEPC